MKNCNIRSISGKGCRVVDRSIITAVWGGNRKKKEDISEVVAGTRCEERMNTDGCGYGNCYRASLDRL